MALAGKDDVTRDGADRANEMSGMAGAVVQAGSITGDIHLHPTQSAFQSPPHELPPDVHAFTDRIEQLEQLDLLLAASDEPTPTAAVVISAVSGTPGVGKTAFAIHWAHRVSDRFPDGQLYVNLRGFGPHTPVSVADALAGFLRSLGVPREDIPLDVDERTARFRSLLAGRRMLIVLDNAAGPEQVRPLLPGTSSCVVLVTSRSVLQGLVSRDGARRVNLDLLPPAQAIDLLRMLIGARVDAEPVAAATLVQECGRLPLALRIAADLAAMNPEVTLAELAGDLENEQERLAALDAGDDPITAVRAVFSWSYRNLPTEQARAFRLLGLHPGRDFEPVSAAILFSTTSLQARRLLDSLVRSHLVERTRTGRYQMHDLIRIYAADLAKNEESAGEQEAARRRLFDFFLATASVAMDILYPQESDRRPRVPTEGSAPLTDDTQAVHWLEAERAALLAMAAHTSHSSWAIFTVALSTILYRFLDSHGHFEDAVTLHTAAVAAGQERDEPVAVGRALHNLGSVYQRLGRYQEAVAYLEQSLASTRQVGQPMVEAFALSDLGLVSTLLGNYDEALSRLSEALRLFEQEGDRTGSGQALNNMGLALIRLGRFEEALGHIQRALAVFRETNDGPRTGYALNDVGMAFQRLGRFGEARNHHDEALSFARETGDRALEAAALNGLGSTNRRLARTDLVLELHEEALRIAQEIGDRYEEAQALEGAASLHQRNGNVALARSHWLQARAIYADLGAPEVEEVDQRVRELES
ncbi:tetratricopeptide repeat protein [Amycolatopsis sp. NPDC004169]|uniref:ATP-binding protein n=1 Tax=Amycolatopsis sp. NPDC004169 TaxID=3154453 RepID=UPI0033A8FD5F